MVPYSMHAALSSDDILSDILLRLPPGTVFKLILVSRGWLDLISSAFFRHMYLARWTPRYHLVGFFVSNSLYLGGCHGGVRRRRSEPALMLLSTSIEGDEMEFSGILKKLGYFIGTSNGVLLCGRHPKSYYVWDPITRRQTQLPRPRVHFEELCVAFIVQDCPDEGISFKVIRAKCQRALEETKTVCIETYSSKTMTWSYSILRCSSTLSLTTWTFGTVVNGVIYWHAAGGYVAVYDPEDEENRRIELIKLPGPFDYDEHVLGESCDGHLLYGWSNKSGLEIWAYGEVDRQWSLRLKMNFKAMWRRNPSLATKFSVRAKETQLVAFGHKYSNSVFIRSDSNIFSYHTEARALEHVPYQGRSTSIVWDFCKATPYHIRSWPRAPLHWNRN